MADPEPALQVAVPQAGSPARPREHGCPARPVPSPYRRRQNPKRADGILVCITIIATIKLIQTHRRNRKRGDELDLMAHDPVVDAGYELLNLLC
ncbi:MAG TPA: hypothetical protein VGX68_03905 [Thermoanaerobaculia bacterium]|nr:hypothetical protein [Thermoanaerobaculia bacterium]